MGKQDDNVKIIIDYLSEGPKTAEEIMGKVGFSKSSWKKYTGHVNKRLSVAGKKLQICKGVYSITCIDSKNSDTQNIGVSEKTFIDEGNYVERSTKDTVMDVLVLNALSQNASKKSSNSEKGLMTSRELTEYIFMNYIRRDDDEVEDEISYFSYPYSAIDSILGVNKLNDGSSGKKVKKPGLIQSGLVEMYDSEKVAQRTFDMTPKAPAYLKLSPEAGCIDINQLNEALQNAGQGYAFSDVLKEIDDLLTLYIDTDVYNIDEYYKKLGFRGNKDSKIEKILKKLNKLDFKKYVLDIEYKAAHPYEAGKAGKEKNPSEKKGSKKSGASVESFKFSVGLVAYISDKDRLYLMGKRKGSEEIIILNAERIVKLTETKKKNEIYGDSEFMQAFDEMFSISVEEPFELQVEFQNTFNIFEKLKRMTAVRPNAVVRLKPGDENTIVYYEEKVRGVEDVAKWLRAFGRSAKVIKPYILKKRMKDSINRALINYGEGQEDE